MIHVPDVASWYMKEEMSIKVLAPNFVYYSVDSNVIQPLYMD